MPVRTQTRQLPYSSRQSRLSTAMHCGSTSDQQQQHACTLYTVM